MQRKLRVPAMQTPFNVVLVEPEIPQNTGNIARLCAATQCPLHLVGRLGFRIDDRSVRRAGVDYWHLVNVNVHPDWTSFALRHAPNENQVKIFSAAGRKSYLDAQWAPGDALVFGRESSGVPREILEKYSESIFGIPTAGAVRSLNLANAVAIVVYEAMRAVGALDGASPEAPPTGAFVEPDDFVR